MVEQDFLCASAVACTEATKGLQRQCQGSDSHSPIVEKLDTHRLFELLLAFSRKRLWKIRD